MKTPGFPEFTQELTTGRDAGLSAALARFHTIVAQPESPVRAIRHEPAAEGEFREIPEAIQPALRQALERRGIRKLYSHQAEAFEAIHAGRNVVIVTPTASGKTLCYNLPVLDLMLREPGARAMYLFPTKALSEDQLHELQTAVDEKIGRAHV